MLAAATVQQHEAVAADECPFDDENAQNVKWWFGLGKVYIAGVVCRRGKIQG